MKATPCRRLDPVTMQVIEILPARALTPTRKERRAARRVAFERQQADVDESVPPPSCEVQLGRVDRPTSVPLALGRADLVGPDGAKDRTFVQTGGSCGLP